MHTNSPIHHGLDAKSLFGSLLAGAAVALLMFLNCEVALAKPLQIATPNARTATPSTGIVLKVRGAHRARQISLYVDGQLRRRDRTRPWRFGHRGRIRLGRGRHRVAVVARYRNRRQVRRRTVLVRRTLKSSARTPLAVTSAKPVKEDDHPSLVRSKKPPKDDSTGSDDSSSTDQPLDGSVFWHGDFETGDLSQWELVQRVAEDRITVVKDPVREGNYAARFEVRQGDNIGDTSPRAEVGQTLGEQEGEERYYRWFTYWDLAFPTDYPDSFITFTQWRALDESRSYTSFMIWGDQIELRRDGTRWATTLTKGVWHEFIYHVKWSPDPDVGFIELWYDGELVLPKLHVRTMAGSPGAAVGNYVKQGLYKSDEIPTGVLYHDGFVSGSSLESVTGA